MNKNKNRYHKTIATIFLVIFFPSILPFNLIYAANNGPVAPEASSFEPVDAADMVNLLTGDMGYVLPLINIPSPEGGYPISLSNHSGIALDQEASWVGLGWGINPGAINRGVTGVPDDWKNRKTNQIVYDAGGVITSYSASVSVGWDKIYSVGLYGSYSENKTFGGTTSYSTNGGISASLGLSDVFGISANIGTDGVGIGAGYIKKGSNYGFGLGVNQSFQDGSSSVSLGVRGKVKDNVSYGSTSVGISFDSKNGLTGSVVGQGFRISGNSYSKGKVNVSSQIYNISAQIYAVNIGLGFSKARYWTYQNNYTKYNGSLYPGTMSQLYNEDNFPSRIAFDSYNSIYKLASDDQLEDDNLSYVGYDSYSVSGQGMSGSIKPSIFEQGSLLNNYKGSSVNNNVISYKKGVNNSFTKNLDTSSNDIYFYFENELSSYLRNSSTSWSSVLNPNITPTQLSPGMSQNSITYIDDAPNNTTIIGNNQYNGYNSTQKRKRTGNYIEVFTNKEILDSNGSLIINPDNFNRTANLKTTEGIGAFRITSIDGKVYHYSIPVYQKEQFTKSTDLKHSFQQRYLENQQLIPYATHWLLTAITGPDYVDTNNNNKVDETDYGFWTSFEYGKWSDGYVWGTPTKSNDKSKMYEWGVKEIYYLDKIKTRTHTALFVKEERQDDLGYEIHEGNNENSLSWKSTVNRSFIRGKNGQLYFDGIYDNPSFYIQNLDLYDIPKQSFGQYINCAKHKSLKLDKILLLKNNDANLVSKSSIPLGSLQYTGQIKINEKLEVWRTSGQLRASVNQTIINEIWHGQYYNNVFDKSDISDVIQQKALKTIKFNYSYQLAKNSTNSNAANKAKLTLDNLVFLGRDQIQILPPYRFGYINTLSYNKNKEDNWGYYEGKPDEWSLNKITTPTGSEIGIIYESDDVEKEAVQGIRGFDSNVQFSFSYDNNKVYITMQNEQGSINSTNFLEFFQIGPLKMDLWASLKHDYHKISGCKSRKGAVDILPTTPSVNITSVNQNQITIEANRSNTQNHNGGLGWMSNKAIGLDNHPGMIRVDLSRGSFGEPPGCINVTDRLVLTYKLWANKISQTSSDKQGGGLRVREVFVSENNLKKNIVRYYYNVPGFGENKTDLNYKSSGITSFIPRKYFKEIKYVSELPSPMVMYEYVTVKNYSTDNQIGVIEEYNFEVLKQDISTNPNTLNIDGILEINKDQQTEWSNCNSINPETNLNESYKLNYSKFSIKDMTANIGRLKKRTIFNSKKQILSKESYNYKNINDIKQGISEESFNTYKKITKSNNDKNYRLSVTSKVKYPSMLEKLETQQGSHVAKIFYDSYDFLTGQLTDLRFMSSDGKIFKTRFVPAYKRYAAMGAKSDNTINKNMLSQLAIEYNYIYDENNGCYFCMTPAPDDPNTNYHWKEIGADITTWNNDWIYKKIDGDNEVVNTQDNYKIWRKNKAYTWNGVKNSNDGTFAEFVRTYQNNYSYDDGFLWNVGVGQPLNSRWKQLSEATLYDHFSMRLESKDINNNSFTTKMGDKDTKIVLNGDAGFNEMYFSGAEYISAGNVFIDHEIKLENGAVRTISKFHTGKYSVSTNIGQNIAVQMKANQHRQGRYKLSVWVHKDNVANAKVITGNSTPAGFNGETYLAGDWVLKTHYFDCTTQANSIYVTSNSGIVYFDDIMIKPIHASITGYVYDEYDQLTYIIGNNGLATKFDYDKGGRLIKTSLEIIQGNGISAGESGFKIKTENITTYKN